MAAMNSQFSCMLPSSSDLDAISDWPASVAHNDDVTGIPTASDPKTFEELMDCLSQSPSVQPQQTSNTLSQPTQAPQSFGHTGISLQLDAASIHNKTAPIMSPFTPPSHSAFGVGLKRKSPLAALEETPLSKKPTLIPNFNTATAKMEPVLVSEPLTPSASQAENAPAAAVSSVAEVANSSVQPFSPLSDSACSDDEDFNGFAPSPTSPLPAPSAQQAAKRRAFRVRSRALKRARALASAKVETCTVVSKDSSSGTGDSGCASGDEDGDIPIDKKIARAIRNRQAAQRSRVEAKAKMQKLAEDNDELACAVETLKEENANLQKQLQALLKHTFGNGHSVDEVLSVFSRVKNSIPQ